MNEKPRTGIDEFFTNPITVFIFYFIFIWAKVVLILKSLWTTEFVEALLDILLNKGGQNTNLCVSG